MSLSKLTSFTHFKTLTKPFRPPTRFLSFATPEEAAAERRRRKRRLRIEPPLNSLRHNQPQRRPQTPIHQNPNPNAPKLPEHVSALVGKRLDLHNRILNLIRDNDLEEASLLTRHSIYSNCKPTIFTCNSVMAAQLRQGKYSELLQLHRFVTQAGVMANVVTHNLLINAYSDCRKIDTALEHYKQLLNDAPFNPSPTTYRILVRGLVDNGKVERAVELKDEMMEKGLGVDAFVYNYLMLGFVKKGESDKALAVYDELKEKFGGFVSYGVVYGNLIKAYFGKGMEKEAMEIYEDAVGEGSRIKMGAVSYNYVLQALVKNGKFEEGVKLFDRMMEEHSPPRKITVNLGSFNVMADGYCEQGRFKEAIEVFRKMGEKRCSPDTLSVNNLIELLCGKGLLDEAEELYREMGDGSKPDEYTYILLMDACFGQNRADVAARYFGKMVESGLRPNLNAYSKVVEGLIKAGKVDEANGIFSQMIERLKLEAGNYEVMLRALCEASKLDETLKLAGNMLRDEKVGLDEEMSEIVRDALKKEGREEDLSRVFEEKQKEDRDKAEALARKAEEEKAAAAAAAEKASSISASTLSLLSGSKAANADAAPAETTSENGGILSSTEEATGESVSVGEEANGESVSVGEEANGESVSVDATPAADVVEEVIEANGVDSESETSDDGVELATSDDDVESKTSDDGVESKTSDDGVAEKTTV